MSDEAPPPLTFPTDDEPATIPGYQGGKEFYIDRDQIPGLPTLVDKVAGNVEGYKAFVRDHTALEGGEGWFNDVSGAHGTIVDTATEWLGRLADPVLSDTASGVRGAVKTYLDADSSNAKSIDSAVPSREVSLGNVPETYHEQYFRRLGVEEAGPFDETQASKLTKPRDRSQDPDLAFQPSYTDAVGLGSGARGSIVEATKLLSSVGIMDKPFDPYDWVIKPVVGDWAGMARCGDVFSTIASNVSGQAHNIDRSRHLLEPVWRGRGADAVVSHLGTVAMPMLDSKQVFTDLAEQYRKAAKAAADFRGAVAGVINNLIDAVAAFLLTIKLGKTPVSLIIAGLGASVEVGIIVWCVNKIIEVYNDANAIMDSVKSAMGNFGQLNATEFILPELPDVNAGNSPMTDFPSK